MKKRLLGAFIVMLLITLIVVPIAMAGNGNGNSGNGNGNMEVSDNSGQNDVDKSWWSDCRQAMADEPKGKDHPKNPQGLGKNLKYFVDSPPYGLMTAMQLNASCPCMGECPCETLGIDVPELEPGTFTCPCED